jgi:hypothetical protein
MAGLTIPDCAAILKTGPAYEGCCGVVNSAADGEVNVCLVLYSYEKFGGSHLTVQRLVCTAIEKWRILTSSTSLSGSYGECMRVCSQLRLYLRGITT